VQPGGGVQTPALHVYIAGHAVAQFPQCAGSVRESTSHPFAAAMSQSRNGPEQVNVHAPAVHAIVAFGSGGHGVHAAPHCVTSVSAAQ